MTRLVTADWAAAAGRMAGLVRRGVAFELGMYRSLYRWVGRRPVVDADAQAFDYAGAVTPILWTFIGLTAVEIPVVHVLLPWETVQIVVLAVGIWGLVWMVGLLASLKVHPHLVSEASLRVRYSTSVDIEIPWDAVAVIRPRRRDVLGSRTVHLEATGTGTVLKLAISSQTNVDLVLRRPRAVPIKGGRETVTELRFVADDPRALVTRARESVAS